MCFSSLQISVGVWEERVEALEEALLCPGAGTDQRRRRRYEVCVAL